MTWPTTLIVEIPLAVAAEMVRAEWSPLAAEWVERELRPVVADAHAQEQLPL